MGALQFLGESGTVQSTDITAREGSINPSLSPAILPLGLSPQGTALQSSSVFGGFLKLLFHVLTCYTIVTFSTCRLYSCS